MKKPLKLSVVLADTVTMSYSHIGLTDDERSWLQEYAQEKYPRNIFPSPDDVTIVMSDAYERKGTMNDSFRLIDTYEDGSDVVEVFDYTCEHGLTERYELDKHGLERFRNDDGCPNGSVRTAEVVGRDLGRLQDYLPASYTVTWTSDVDDRGRQQAHIEGHDVAGWTMDAYVLPRLASGLMYGTEI